MDCATIKTRGVMIFRNHNIPYGTSRFRFMTYLPVLSPAKEDADSTHYHATPCQRIRFHYGRVTRGDAQKNRFSSGRDVFSHWTECSNMISLNCTTNPSHG